MKKYHTTCLLLYVVQFQFTEEPRYSAFKETSGFYALLQDMLYCQYIELKENASKDL